MSNGARVHEVEGSLFELILDDVVHTDFQIPEVERPQEARVDVCCHDSPGWPRASTQPFGNRAAPTADL